MILWLLGCASGWGVYLKEYDHGDVDTSGPGDSAESIAGNDSDDSDTDVVDTTVDSVDTTETAETADTVETAETAHTGETAETGDTGTPIDTPDVVVDCHGGADFVTIGEAIAASVSGTKIGLMPCTYSEDVSFDGKTLDVYGLKGSEQTIIRGLGEGPVFTAVRGESLGSRLAGVTVTGGGRSYGSAFYLDGVVLEIADVVISGNNATYAAIYGSGIALTMLDVTLTDNRGASGGAVISVDNGSIIAQRVNIECGSVSYGIYEHNVTLMLDSTVDCSAASYGIVVSGGEVQLRRTAVRADSIGVYGADGDDTRNERVWLYNATVVGGDNGVQAEYMHVRADNNVLWGGTNGLEMTACHIESEVFDSALIGGSCGVRGDSNDYTFGWNAFGTGRACRVETFGDITADPLFVDAPADFHLGKGSPLIDAGNPDADRDDADGSRNDVGAYGGPAGSDW